MQVSVAGLRRNIKNIAHNYTEPQKKVREATSNDPWGPSSTLMSEIADLTYNIEAFAQIMEMLWKRLNDHGKNWRHVYKSLVLLEYLIKTGSERVAQQCKENIFAIQTLKDFQYFEDNKDQGMNVREKAKQLVTLLTSEERLRNERARALKARERFAQTVSGFGSSDSNETTPTSPVFGSAFGHGSNDMTMNGHRSGGSSSSRHAATSSSHNVNPELEQARPQTIGEEELQLQLALAMSKEEADQEEKRRRSDELKLQMALSQSQDQMDTNTTNFRGPSSSSSLNNSNNSNTSPPNKNNSSNNNNNHSSALVDLLDVDLGGAAGLEAQGAVGGIVGPDPWAPKINNNHHHHHQQQQRGGGGGGGGMADPWSASSSTLTSPQDPWNHNGSPAVAAAISADPWSTSHGAGVAVDPWSPGGGGHPVASPMVEDEFDILSKRTGDSNNSFNLDPLSSNLLTPMNHTSRSANSTPVDNLGGVGRVGSYKKDPLDFLGENSALVNLDNLVPPLTTSNNLSLVQQANPFAAPHQHQHQHLHPTTSLLSSSGPGNGGMSNSQPVNPFHLQNPIKPSINEIREKQQQVSVGQVGSVFGGGTSPNTRSSNQTNNPWSPVKDNPFN